MHSQAFGTQYLDPSGQLQLVHQTSWGVSTRMIGGIIMAHGDDKGLRLPPKIAPVQVHEQSIHAAVRDYPRPARFLEVTGFESQMWMFDP